MKTRKVLFGLACVFVLAGCSSEPSVDESAILNKVCPQARNVTASAISAYADIDRYGWYNLNTSPWEVIAVQISTINLTIDAEDTRAPGSRIEDFPHAFLENVVTGNIDIATKLDFGDTMDDMSKWVSTYCQ